MAEKSRPETAVKSSRMQLGTWVRAQGLPETVGQAGGAPEEKIAAQPVGLNPCALGPQDGSVGDGTDLVAVALTRAEPRLDRLHPAEAHDKEGRGDRHADGHPLEHTDECDDDKDQHNNGVLRARQPTTSGDEPVIHHAQAGEEQDPAQQRHRHQLQHRLAEEQRAAPRRRQRRGRSAVFRLQTGG